MSVTITTDIFCDGPGGDELCGNWTHGVTGPRVDIVNARKVAAGGAGWEIKRGSDRCPECARKARNANPDKKAT